MSDRHGRDTADDRWGEHPPMQVLRRFPARRPLRWTSLALVAIVALVGIAATVWAVATDRSTTVQGASLLVAVAAIANAVWQLAAGFDRIEVVEPRATHLSAARTAAHRMGRRPMLRRLMAAGAGVVGLGVLAGLARFGPRAERPGQTWRGGVRLTTETGQALRPDDIPAGGFATAWPEQSDRLEVAAVMLVRLTAEPTPPTELEWVVDDRLLAYSKVCSHAGCPVGLFRETDNALHCPCHHAEFDAARGATPLTGPASRPLPQLPLGVDGDGFLIATDDFPAPVVPVRKTERRR